MILDGTPKRSTIITTSDVTMSIPIGTTETVPVTAAEGTDTVTEVIRTDDIHSHQHDSQQQQENQKEQNDALFVVVPSSAATPFNGCISVLNEHTNDNHIYIENGTVDSGCNSSCHLRTNQMDDNMVDDVHSTIISNFHTSCPPDVDVPTNETTRLQLVVPSSTNSTIQMMKVVEAQQEQLELNYHFPQEEEEQQQQQLQLPPSVTPTSTFSTQQVVVPNNNNNGIFLDSSTEFPGIQKQIKQEQEQAHQQQHQQFQQQQQPYYNTNSEQQHDGDLHLLNTKNVSATLINPTFDPASSSSSSVVGLNFHYSRMNSNDNESSTENIMNDEEYCTLLNSLQDPDNENENDNDNNENEQDGHILFKEAIISMGKEELDQKQQQQFITSEFLQTSVPINNNHITNTNHHHHHHHALDSFNQLHQQQQDQFLFQPQFIEQNEQQVQQLQQDQTQNDSYDTLLLQTQLEQQHQQQPDSFYTNHHQQQQLQICDLIVQRSQQQDQQPQQEEQQQQHQLQQHPSHGQQQQLICLICGRGEIEYDNCTKSASEGGVVPIVRPIVRFLPVEHDWNALQASPSVQTFQEDISLHIFCGKTASILPSVKRPDLEILSKAGIKNKHGIGPDVNAALARTRQATNSMTVEYYTKKYQNLVGTTTTSSSSSSPFLNMNSNPKEKHFYLVREFEAHLAAIRHTHISYNTKSIPLTTSLIQSPQILSSSSSTLVSQLGSNQQQQQPLHNEQQGYTEPQHVRYDDGTGCDTHISGSESYTGLPMYGIISPPSGEPYHPYLSVDNNNSNINNGNGNGNGNSNSNPGTSTNNVHHQSTATSSNDYSQLPIGGESEPYNHIFSNSQTILTSRESRYLRRQQQNNAGLSKKSNNAIFVSSSKTVQYTKEKNIKRKISKASTPQLSSKTRIIVMDDMKRGYKKNRMINQQKVAMSHPKAGSKKKRKDMIWKENSKGSIFNRKNMKERQALNHQLTLHTNYNTVVTDIEDGAKAQKITDDFLLGCNTNVDNFDNICSTYMLSGTHPESESGTNTMNMDIENDYVVGEETTTRHLSNDSNGLPTLSLFDHSISVYRDGTECGRPMDDSTMMQSCYDLSWHDLPQGTVASNKDPFKGSQEISCRCGGTYLIENLTGNQRMEMNDKTIIKTVLKNQKELIERWWQTHVNTKQHQQWILLNNSSCDQQIDSV